MGETTPPEDLFRPLLDGNKRFIGKNTQFKRLSGSQDPKFLVISCSDSRVAPSVVMDAPLGAIFEIRIAGEVVDKSTIASVEFALEYLNIKGIMVMGHTNCGAVTEAQKILLSGKRENSISSGTALSGTVEEIIGIISLNPVNREDLTNAIMDNTKGQLEKLRKSDIVRNWEKSGSGVIVAAIYDIASGNLRLF